MSNPGDDVLAALRDFVHRIDELAPDASVHCELTIGPEQFILRTPVARALIEALRSYHDPRDQGRCDHCGSPRVDENFFCLNCGRFSGVFGLMVAERAAVHTEPAELPEN